MANVLNLQADTAEVAEDTKYSGHTSIFWCKGSPHSVWMC